MNIRDPKSLRAGAEDALRVGREPKKVILYYAGIIALLGLAVSVVDFVLGLQQADATGLSNLGTNAMISSVRSFLPLVQMFVAACLELGYRHSMLRVGRKLYADQNNLKEGFRRFGPLMRYMLLQFAGAMIISFVLSYPVSIIYVISPLGRPLMELVLTNPEIANQMLTDETVMLQVMELMQNVMWIFIPVYLIAVTPLFYHLRMGDYLLADRPGTGAIRAAVQSFRMMRRNCLNLFKLDLRLWWYHGLLLLVSAISYADQIAALAGISLPWSAEVSFLICQIGYLAGTFGVYYFFRNPVELTYIMAYQRLLPPEPKPNGVVLGSIFQN